MAYLVLARKYRPQSFADLVGQDAIVRILGNAIAGDRVHHAFVLAGARGTGKTTTARLLARALNCAAGPRLVPCGTCAPCRDIPQGCCSDVLEIDGASNTGVDNVRELRESARYLPAAARFKLYIIDEVHMLTGAAFNALLKTLEEPPPHVKFIFATTEPHKIPVTILSRTQRLDFRRVGTPALQAHLAAIVAREGVTVSKAVLGAVARAAQGSVRDALSLLDQALSYGLDGAADDAQVLEAIGAIDQQAVFAACDAIWRRDAASLLALIEQLDSRGHELAQVAALLAEHFRDLAVVKHLGTPRPAQLDRSSGEVAALAEQARGRSHTDLQRLFREALVVAEDVGRSLMPRMSLEMGLLRMFEVAPTGDLDRLLEGLDALAKGGAGAVGSGASGALQHQATRAAAGSQVGSAQALAGARDEAARAGQGAQVEASGALLALQVEAPRASPALQVEASRASLAPQFAPQFSPFVDRVRQARPVVASVLEHAHVVAFATAGVELAYRPSTFYWDAAREPSTQALLRGLLADYFGETPPLTIVPLRDDAQPAPSLAESGEQRRRRYEEEVADGAGQHDAVQGAMRILGAQLEEVRPLAEAPREAAAG